MKNIMNGHGPNALTKRAGSSKSDIVSILHSAHVDDLYQRNRDERSAAIQLQAWWRHYSIRTKFELMARQGRLIVRIQALVRGVIYRKRIAEWYTQRLRMVTGWQRLIRRGLSNRRIARSRAAETVLIMHIQALYRGRRDRSLVMTMRHAQAATTIQRVWRGAVGRVLADRLWLDINITPMQKVARGMLARKAVAVYRSSRHSAAVTLQRCFRGYTARYQRAQAAVQRETDRRQTSMLACYAILKHVIQVVNTAVAKSRTVWCSLELVTFTYIQADSILTDEKPNESCQVIFEIDTSSHKDWPLCATDVS
eukprot:857-Heterococcus_DN1.PRE.1